MPTPSRYALMRVLRFIRTRAPDYWPEPMAVLSDEELADRAWKQFQRLSTIEKAEALRVLRSVTVEGR
jgi:hypothetical protein